MYSYYLNFFFIHFIHDMSFFEFTIYHTSIEIKFKKPFKNILKIWANLLEIKIHSIYC
jgi:hypothetical protein